MYLGGWSRIGIVLSALYGIFVAFVAYDSRPRIEYKHSTWFSEAAVAIAEVLSKTEGYEVKPFQVKEELLKGSDTENVVWLEKVANSPSENQKKFSVQVASVNQKHKAIIGAFSSELITHWLLSVAWWVGGVLMLFGVGWLTAWVYRGFRPSAS